METSPVDLSKLSKAVKNDVVNKSLYGELVKKVNDIDSDQKNLEKKIEDVDNKTPDTSKFAVT